MKFFTRHFIVSSLLVAGVFVPLTSQAVFENNPMSLLGIKNTETPSNNVHLIVEADTNAPYFYQGRREPTAGNSIRLIAVVDRELANIPNLQYKFIVEDRTLNNNQNTVSFIAPDKNEISVTIQVLDEQKTVAETSELIPLSKPVLLFYEENLLRGSSKIAVENNYILVGEEATLKIIPYFMSKNINTSDFYTNWTIDGREVTVGEEWESITITRPDSDLEKSVISFSMTNRIRLFEKAEKSFILNFGL